jgi:hypothetical protein
MFCDHWLLFAALGIVLMFVCFRAVCWWFSRGHWNLDQPVVLRPRTEFRFSFSARDCIVQCMNRRWTNEHERQLLELRATGLTWRAIAKKVGRSEASVVTRVAIMKARIDRERQDDTDFRASTLSALEFSHG